MVARLFFLCSISILLVANTAAFIPLYIEYPIPHNFPYYGTYPEGKALSSLIQMAKDGTQKHNAIEKTIEIAAGSTEIKNQRLHIEKLMQNIDQPIELSEPKKPTVKPPPEIVLNVRGSSAGAGSSDFHTYREQRRKENLRIQLMEKAAAEDEEKERFAREMASLKRKDEEKTAKNRAKRLKKKQNRSGKANLDNKDKE